MLGGRYGEGGDALLTWVFVVDWEEELLSWGPSRRKDGGEGGGGTFWDAGAVTAGLLLAMASMLDTIAFCAWLIHSRHGMQEDAHIRIVLDRKKNEVRAIEELGLRLCFGNCLNLLDSSYYTIAKDHELYIANQVHIIDSSNRLLLDKCSNPIPCCPVRSVLIILFAPCFILKLPCPRHGIFR